MSLILELPPDAEKRLRDIAEQEGSTPSEWVLRMVDSYGQPSPIPSEKLKHTLKELAAIGDRLPPVPEETYSRETLYADSEY